MDRAPEAKELFLSTFIIITWGPCNNWWFDLNLFCFFLSTDQHWPMELEPLRKKDLVSKVNR